MNALDVLRRGASMIYNHPDLARWYLQNKFRVPQVLQNQRNGGGVSRFPLGITFKPTFSCNLRCRMCSFVTNGSVFTNPRDSLPFDVWRSVVDDVKEWNPYIWFTGGEPTLYPHFIELVRYIKSQNMLCGVTTNGTTLKRIAEEIIQSPPDMMVVSIDGKGDIHNIVRGNPAAFDRTVEGILTMQEQRRRHGIQKPLLVVNCAMSPDNIEHIAEMPGVAKMVGADALNFQHLWQLTSSMVAKHNARWGAWYTVSYDDCGGMEPKPMDAERVIEVVHEIKRMKVSIPVTFHPDITDDDIRIYYNEPERFVVRRPAACAWLNTDILPNGDVSPCFDVIVGNIQESRFTELWNNYYFREHRRRLQEEGDFPICARCCAYWRRD